MFTTRETTPRPLHTPISYRAQRQLNFTSPNSAPNGTSSSSNPAPASNSSSTSDPASQDAASLLLHFSTPSVANTTSTATSDTNEDDDQSLLSAIENPQDDSNSTTRQQPSLTSINPHFQIHAPGRVLPWEFEGNKFTSLYKHAPPKLTYPGGSTSQSKNNRFVKRMDMYLNKNFLVRSAIKGDTPHPFISYERLQQYWHKMGKANWRFNTSETFATLDAIQSNGHHTFHAELTDLLWFGGTVSYGNIMAETYNIIFDFIGDDDLTDACSSVLKSFTVWFT